MDRDDLYPSKLTSCSACGGKIAKSARTCPHCGKTRTTAAGIVVALILGFVICAILSVCSRR